MPLELDHNSETLQVHMTWSQELIQSRACSPAGHTRESQRCKAWKGFEVPSISQRGTKSNMSRTESSPFLTASRNTGASVQWLCWTKWASSSPSLEAEFSPEPADNNSAWLTPWPWALETLSRKYRQAWPSALQICRFRNECFLSLWVVVICYPARENDSSTPIIVSDATAWRIQPLGIMMGLAISIYLPDGNRRKGRKVDFRSALRVGAYHHSPISVEQCSLY